MLWLFTALLVRVLLCVVLLFSVSTLAFFVAALRSEASRTEVLLRVALLTSELLRSIDELLLLATPLAVVVEPLLVS